MILLKNVQKIGTLRGLKVEKKVKCLTKWVRLAPIELKLCRNDQAMIRTSILLILAKLLVFGLWSLVFGLGSLVIGLWSLVFGLWSLVIGLLVIGLFSSTNTTNGLVRVSLG